MDPAFHLFSARVFPIRTRASTQRMNPGRTSRIPKARARAIVTDGISGRFHSRLPKQFFDNLRRRHKLCKESN
eukprot:11175404-Lingulodinium_polyedra.AAC.1